MKRNLSLSLVIAVVFALLTFNTLASSADARNCKKGKPCGNSCISKNDVCHKESTSPTEAPVAAPKSEAPPVADPKMSTPVDGAKDGPAGAAKAAPKAKTCTKGKACGNTCIPKDAVCHE